MALIKKDYGLIYNDDGSLCTTVRKDDVPFPGVSSFAVEEGTENLINPLGGTAQYNVTTEYSGYIETVTVVNAEATAYIRYDIASSSPSPTGTISFYVAKKSTVSYLRFNLWDAADSSKQYLWAEFDLSTGELKNLQHGAVRSQVVESNDWWRIIVSTDSIDTSVNEYYFDIVAINADANQFFIIDKIQLEAKPFATSFCDPADFTDKKRPAGKFTLFDDATVRNWSNTGIVISAWCKRDAPIQSSDDVKLFSATQTGGFNFEKQSGTNWRALIFYNGAYHSFDAVPYDYFNDLQWHQVTLIYGNDYSLKVFVDGIKKVDVNLGYPIGWNSSIQYALNIGYEYGENSCWWNGLISNLLIAEYDPDFWTDEYIKYIYEQKMPFNVQPTVPIV